MPSSRSRNVVVALLVLLAAAAVFLLTGGPIDPLSWTPPEAPALAGPLAPNELLAAAERLAEGRLRGPEALAFDAEGRIYAGTEDGELLRLDGDAVEKIAETGGRPLGIEFDGDGRLVIADAEKGLLRLEADGTLTVLTTEAGGLPLAFTDDLDVASDGRVYFSDASWRHSREELLEDCLEARPYGRLLRYDPATGETETLKDGLYFANGVALSRDEGFVLVNETYRYRVTRYWLRGPQAGTTDVFADNLPGFPDNLSASGRGTFWVAFFTVRNPRLDRLHPSAFLKRQLAKLPRSVWPKPQRYGMIAEIDEAGRILRSLQDPGGERVPQVTSVEEVDGHLYLGNLEHPFLSRVTLAP